MNNTPDKVGLWWASDRPGTDPILMTVVKDWNGLTYRKYGDAPRTDGPDAPVRSYPGLWLGPALGPQQADDLQRHAAALEDQVDDLEDKVCIYAARLISPELRSEQFRAEYYGVMHALEAFPEDDALTDGPGDV